MANGKTSDVPRWISLPFSASVRKWDKEGEEEIQKSLRGRKKYLQRASCKMEGKKRRKKNRLSTPLPLLPLLSLSFNMLGGPPPFLFLFPTSFPNMPTLPPSAAVYIHRRRKKEGPLRVIALWLFEGSREREEAPLLRE